LLRSLDQRLGALDGSSALLYENAGSSMKGGGIVGVGSAIVGHDKDHANLAFPTAVFIVRTPLINR
jgi:hypothetical protein